MVLVVLCWIVDLIRVTLFVEYFYFVFSWNFEGFFFLKKHTG